jgi:poly(3-hydroxybutyrate) depolymerase
MSSGSVRTPIESISENAGVRSHPVQLTVHSQTVGSYFGSPQLPVGARLAPTVHLVTICYSELDFAIQVRMKNRLLPLCFVLAGSVFAATEVRYTFTLQTTDADGMPIQQTRSYVVYRPDNLPRTTPVPLVVVLDNSTSNFQRIADRYGFVVAGCSFSGNSTGNPGSSWNNDNPRIAGWEDFDYLDEVIRRVRADENASDSFTTGLSKDGHMSMAYACERPDKIKAAATLDEFMQLTLNIPSAPLPIIAFQGTLDTNVPYTMLRDTVDQWRTVDGLRSAVPVTSFESSPLQPGKVSQVTWRGGDWPGAHRIHSDLAILQLEGPGTREVAHSRLTRGVGAEAWHAQHIRD